MTEHSINSPKAVLFDLGDTLWHFPKMPATMDIRMETMRRIKGALDQWGVPLDEKMRFLGKEIRLGVEKADRAAYESDCVSPDFNEVVRQIGNGMGLDLTYEQGAQLWDAWNIGGLTLGRTMFDACRYDYCVNNAGSRSHARVSTILRVSRTNSSSSSSFE